MKEDLLVWLKDCHELITSQEVQEKWYELIDKKANTEMRRLVENDKSWKGFLDSCFNDNKGLTFIRLVKIMVPNVAVETEPKIEDLWNLWHKKYLDRSKCLTFVGLAQTMNTVKYPGEPNLKDIYCLWDETNFDFYRERRSRKNNKD